MKTLRDDQASTIDKLRAAVGNGKRRVVLQAPTGWGKTLVISDLIERARSKSKRVIVTVPTISLVDQTVEVLFKQGVRDLGVIQANHQMTDWSKPIQIASVQTLMKRGAPEADLVLVDEVHKWFSFFEKWFHEEKLAKVPVVGFSATPWLRGLGSYFDELIIGNTIEGMIKQKTLAPFRVFAPDKPDLSEVRMTGGDYNEGDLDKAMRKGALVANIVETWKALGENRPTIVFCVTRAHAEQVAKEFVQDGIPAGYLDCDTPLVERHAVRKRFLSGEIKVVCNVDVIGLGVDWPEVSCLVYARPTRSEMRFVQNIGRGLRVAPGKKDLLVIDHSDTHRRMGFVTDIVHSVLDNGKTPAGAERGVLLPKECPKCHFMKAPRVVICPNCGFKVEAHAKPIPVERGTLREIKPDDGKAAKKRAEAQFPDKGLTYAMLLGHARARKYADGWAYHKYKALYGVAPFNTRNAVPTEPSWELALWIKSQNIRWAKSKQRQQTPEQRAQEREQRDQRIIDAVREKYVSGTLCTEQDLADFS